MTKFEEVQEKLKQIGYTQEKIQELVELLAPEVEHSLFYDVAEKLSDQDVEGYTQRIRQAQDKDAYNSIVAELAKIAYGEQYEAKMHDLFAQQLDQIAEQTLKMRSTYRKYAAGDPDTVKSVNDAANSEDVKKIMQQMKEDGFDFPAEATK
ncbi:hypothetical protein JW887_04505 [Candidatus Dojkabacteria bacterium]|nr:hypothetical protein [Candidatus Dojkabacteria bacterium]